MFLNNFSGCELVTLASILSIYISNGLGTSGINARLNNHPSINLYRFYKTK